MKNIEAFYIDEGWNEEELEERLGIMSILADCSNITYEIKNSPRGAYAISGDEMIDLLEDLVDIRDRLDEVINYK